MGDRVVRFRAWNGNEMVSPDCIDRNGFARWTEDSIPVITDKIMQFTGLKDKNGVAIYEGDIVANRFTKTGEIFKQEVVKWGVYDIGVNGREYDFKIIGPYIEDEYLYGEMIDGNVEIIGNIYQHPHLIATP